MEPLLTLVIALGSIATGIGAIWTAVVTRHLARATEESVAEQSQSLREQNERARLTLEYDMLTRLGERTDVPHFLSRRREAAKYLLDNAFVDDAVVEVERLNAAAMDVCSVLEEVGEMLRLEVLRAEPVWNRFGIWAQGYWSVCKPTIEKMREQEEDPSLFEEFEYLCQVLDEMDRKRGVAPRTQEWLRRFIEDEACIGQDHPSATK
jgi:hypothetical protein